jgi:glutathione synthase
MPKGENSMPPLTSVFIIDSPKHLDPPTDTSLALMRESLKRGHRVYFCTIDQLRLEMGTLRASVRPVDFPPGMELFRSGEARDLDLGTIDVLHMRKDPPVDEAYFHTTFLLDHLPRRVLQVNPAESLRNFCEKLIPLQFPELMPETVVTSSVAALDAFLGRHERIVIKPLGNCSGRDILSLTPRTPERRALLAQATADGTRILQAQRFLPEIVEGDKRVLMLDGEILGWVRRLPREGEFRSNINAGGRCVPCDLEPADRAICARIGPWLKQREILLAGIDIVGAYVLEVNITSPSCLREMNALTGQRLEERIIDVVEARCAKVG